MVLAYRLLAAKYIRRQAKQLAAQLEGVRAAEDIEFVHRARVASRRLRAALRVFSDAFAAKRIDDWQKAIRRITSALGDARDRDVQIELLCGKLSELKSGECFPGLARILVQLEHDRERFQRHVVKAVTRLERSRALDEMRRASKKIINEAEETPASLLPTEVHHRIEAHVVKQLDELLALQDCLANPQDRDRHHAMRIAAKRLRYTLEIFRPLFPHRLNATVDAIKKLQTLLGEIHDCDVWLDHLENFAATERQRISKMFGHAGRFIHLQAGIEYLAKDRAAHHQATFQELAAYWDELGQQRLWDELKVLLQPPQAPPSPVKTASSEASATEAILPGPSDSQPTASEAAETLLPAPANSDQPPVALSDGAAEQSSPARKPLLTTGF